MVRIFILTLLLSCIPVASYAAQKEMVVMLHGIFRTHTHMQPLADYLEKEGYDVLNLDYPSTRYRLATLVEHIAKDMDTRIEDKTRKIHFVGYSMGGLLVRGIIAKHKPKNLGRVVLLGTPNHGSEVADFLKDNLLYRKFYGPAGQQLTSNNTEIDQLCGKVNYELGIIAGNFTIDPLSSSLIEGDDDGKVSIESTKVEGMKAHTVVSSSHTFFPSNAEVQRQTLAFLRAGKFE